MLANISMIYKFPYKNVLHMLYIFLNCLLVKNTSQTLWTLQKLKQITISEYILVVAE